MTKRDMAAGLLRYSGAGTLQVQLERVVAKDKLIILAYHRIAELDAEADFLDPELISASAAQFEGQVRYLAEHYSVVSFAQLLEAMEGKRQLKRTPVIITLDDGYLDNFEIAYPILKKYGVPATIFAAANFIGRQELFWWDYVYYALRHTKVKKLLFSTDVANLGILATENVQEKNNAKNKIIALLKTVKNEQRLAILDEMAKQVDVPAPPATFRPTVTWQEVKLMAQNGIEFGGHTLSHPILTSLSDEALAYEIQKSKERLEAELKSKAVSFCYPVGQGGAVDQRVFEAVKRAGFKFATLAHHGVNSLKGSNLLQLLRLRVSPIDSQTAFEERIHFPNIFTY